MFKLGETVVFQDGYDPFSAFTLCFAVVQKILISLAVLVCSRLDLFCNVLVSIFLVIDSHCYPP